MSDEDAGSYEGAVYYHSTESRRWVPKRMVLRPTKNLLEIYEAAGAAGNCVNVLLDRGFTVQWYKRDRLDSRQQFVYPFSLIGASGELRLAARTEVEREEWTTARLCTLPSHHSSSLSASDEPQTAVSELFGSSLTKTTKWGAKRVRYYILVADCQKLCYYSKVPAASEQARLRRGATDCAVGLYDVSDATVTGPLRGAFQINFASKVLQLKAETPILAQRWVEALADSADRATEARADAAQLRFALDQSRRTAAPSNGGFSATWPARGAASPEVRRPGSERMASLTEDEELAAAIALSLCETPPQTHLRAESDASLHILHVTSEPPLRSYSLGDVGARRDAPPSPLPKATRRPVGSARRGTRSQDTAPAGRASLSYEGRPSMSLSPPVTQRGPDSTVGPRPRALSEASPSPPRDAPAARLRNTSAPDAPLRSAVAPPAPPRSAPAVAPRSPATPPAKKAAARSPAAPAKERFIVTARSNGGLVVPCQVPDGSSTVLDLKKLLCASAPEFLPARTRVVFQGKPLADAATLAASRIVDGSDVFVVLKLTASAS
ncbi:hypothetical protein M885DRAFT_618519 [Pelagophyceae sp. CCMP2097]|nr:hypothetical protein M885DRAFT_618519 [Pelagophyceae sp. CCMP2097]